MADFGAEWDNQAVNQLVVLGPGGGVFAYTGAPALGNPPIAWLTNGGLKDPFGNTLPAVMGVQGLGNFYVGSEINLVNGGQISGTAGGGINLQAVAGETVFAAGGPFNAVDGTAAAPTVITTDTWHAVTPPTGTSGLLRYRLRAENDVEVNCQLAVTTGVSSSNPLTLLTGLAAAYTPASTTRGGLGIFVNGTATVAELQALVDMRWSANPAGTFTIQGWTGGALNTGVTELDFTIRYPLD